METWSSKGLRQLNHFITLKSLNLCCNFIKAARNLFVINLNNVFLVRADKGVRIENCHYTLKKPCLILDGLYVCRLY